MDHGENNRTPVVDLSVTFAEGSTCLPNLGFIKPVSFCDRVVFIFK
jgi:hypothetical protein